MSDARTPPGRLLRAPESFLDTAFVKEVNKEGFNEERRGWMRRAFAAAAATVRAGSRGRGNGGDGGQE